MNWPSFSIERDGGTTSYRLDAWPSGASRYLLQLPAASEFDPNQPGVLRVTDQRCGAAELELATCGPQSVTLTIAPTSSLIVNWPADFKPGSVPVVKLLDLTGKLIREERCWHTNELENGMLISLLRPGQYRLILELDVQYRLPVLEQQIELAAGFNHVELEPPALTSLKVTTADPDVWRFELVFGDVTQSCHLGKDGMLLKDMPPGNYTIRYRKRPEKEDRERAFILPGVSTIELD